MVLGAVGASLKACKGDCYVNYFSPLPSWKEAGCPYAFLRVRPVFSRNGSRYCDAMQARSVSAKSGAPRLDPIAASWPWRAVDS